MCLPNRINALIIKSDPREIMSIDIILFAKASDGSRNIVKLIERHHSVTRFHRPGAELKELLLKRLTGPDARRQYKLTKRRTVAYIDFRVVFFYLFFVFFLLYDRRFSYISEIFIRIYTAITKSRTFRWLLWPRSKSHSASLSSNASEKPEGGSSLGMNRFPDPSRSCSRLA